MDCEPEKVNENEPEGDVSIKEDKEKAYFKDNQVIELAKINIKNTTNQHYFQGSIFSPDGNFNFFK
jgi:hypothetical protein